MDSQYRELKGMIVLVPANLAGCECHSGVLGTGESIHCRMSETYLTSWKNLVGSNNKLKGGEDCGGKKERMA